MEQIELLPIAQALLKDVEQLSKLRKKLKSLKTLSSDFNDTEAKGSELRYGLLRNTQQLQGALQDPEDFLLEFVASNWEKGALYCLLDNGIIDRIPKGGKISVQDLAEKLSIPEKLLPILRLLSCDQIIKQETDGTFSLSPISHALVKDPGLRAFIGFQYVYLQLRDSPDHHFSSDTCADYMRGEWRVLTSLSL